MSASLSREPEIRLPEADWNRSGMSDSGAPLPPEDVRVAAASWG